MRFLVKSLHVFIFLLLLSATLLIFTSKVSASTFVTFEPTWRDNDSYKSMLNPWGLGVDKNGNIYVADNGHNRMIRFDKNGRQLFSWPIDSPKGVAVGEKDTRFGKITVIYVTDNKNNVIKEFDDIGIPLWTFDNKDAPLFIKKGFSDPSGIALSKDGRVYVADTNNHRILSFVNRGEDIKSWGGRGYGPGQFSYPEGVTVNERYIFVGDTCNFRIQVFLPDGKYLCDFCETDALNGRPSCLVLDRDKSMYVPDQDPFCVREFTMLGFLGSYINKWEGFNNPKGICTDGGGNIYVTDTYNNRIMVRVNTLKKAFVKGQKADSLGSPSLDISSVKAGKVTLTAEQAADTTGKNPFITLFQADNNGATVKVVKYAAGSNIGSSFATDAAYSNEAINNGDFFIIRLTEGTSTNVCYYYRIDVDRIIVPVYTLNESSAVKGQNAASLGSPSLYISSVTAGKVTLTAAQAADTTGKDPYKTLFQTDDTGVTVKAVKYAAGSYTGRFATDAAYSNEAINTGDFFIIRLRKETLTNVCYYYRINVGMEITKASVNITPPVCGQIAQQTQDVEAATANIGYTVTSFYWDGMLENGRFMGDRVYRASVELTAKNGNYFTAAPFTPTVPGAASVRYTRTTGTGEGNRVAFEVTFEKTAPKSVIAIEVDISPEDLVYTEGDKLDLGQLQVTLTFNDTTVMHGYWNMLKSFGIETTVSPAAGTILTDAEHQGLPVVVSCNGLQATTENLTVLPRLSALAGDEHVKLSWTPIRGATSYRISSVNPPYEAATVDGSANSYDFLGLVNNRTYGFRISAILPNGRQLSSDIVRVTPQPQALAAPVLQSAEVQDGCVSLKWNPVPEAKGYNIYIGTTPGAYDSTPATVDSSADSYKAVGLSNGTYYFIVKAFNSEGESPASNEVSASIADSACIVLIDPAILTESAANDGSLSSETVVITIANGILSEGLDNTSVTSANLPAGLNYSVNRDNDTQLTISITGKADQHSNADDINNLSFTIAQSMVSNAAGDLTADNIRIDFNDPGVEKASSPTAQPETGTIKAGTRVELSCDTDGARIHYTTNGKEPTSKSKLYNQPIRINRTTVIKAKAVKTGMSDSDTATFVYTVVRRHSSDDYDPSEDITPSTKAETMVLIPGDAPKDNTDVNIAVSSVDTPPAAPDGFTFLGNVYEYNVDGIDKEVTLFYTFDPDKLLSGQTPALFHYDLQQGQWVNLGGIIAGNNIHTSLGKFGKYAVMAKEAAKQAPPNEKTESNTALSESAESNGRNNEDSALNTTGSGHEAIVQIPAEARKGKTDIKVEVSMLNTSPAAPAGFKVLGNVYEFNVDGIEKEAALIFTFDPDQVPSGQTPAVYCYNQNQGQWINMGGAISDNTIRISAAHFGKFAVMTKEAAKPFITITDISGHWAESNIRKLVNTGAISGYPDGSFKPDQNITRSEFAATLVKAFKIPLKQGEAFFDTSNHWAQDYIITASSAGIISGYGNSQFGPNDPITREQMALMISKAAGIKDIGNMPAFNDSNLISPWARDAVAAAVAGEILAGYPDHCFKPQASTTRAEAVTTIMKALSR